MKTIPYGHQYIDDEDIKEVNKVLKSGWITQGKKVDEFEKAVCKYAGVKYAVAVSSGTAALHLASKALGFKDEVITTPITFAASSNSVLYCGGKPVFSDISKTIPNISPDKIKEKITKKTKGIIPVDYSGHPCDLEEIHEIACEHDLKIIEDSSHAIGARYKNSKIGSCKYSDISIFSFHPVKHITTGEGGMILTNNEDIYDKLVMLRSHGITKKKEKLIEDHGPWYHEQQILGYNYRITDFQCALGLSQLKKLDDFIKKRREIVDIYKDQIKNPDLIELPAEKNNCKSSWHLYYIKIKDSKKRKDVFIKLRKKNIGCQVHYIPVYFHPYYQKLGYKKGLCPNAEEFYKRTISIPLYPTLKDNEIQYVIDTLNSL